MALSRPLFRACPRMMKRTFESGAHARTIALLAAAIFVVSMAAAANEASAAPTLDLVQVGLQTSLSYPYQYSLTAYNTSGYQVASYQSGFPGAAFQLPAGTYLLTASAYYQNSTSCYNCPLVGGTGSSASSGSAGGAVTATIIKPYGEVSEYGYSLTKVSGPTSISINLRNASALPLTQLSIHVGYANGTAAAGASVSGYVVGSYYVYSPKTTSYGQTGKTGDVTLTMPQAPVEVSAYLSVPIKLPSTKSTVTVNVGGQMINVTVYMQPSAISLNGEALILPPQTSASIVLHYQPNNYPIVYAGGPTVSGTGAVSPSGATAQTSQQTTTESSQTQAATRIAPFSPTGSQLTTASPSSNGSQSTDGASVVVIEVSAVGGALVVAVAVSALFMRKARSGAPPA
jgi:hypothetical protein